MQPAPDQNQAPADPSELPTIPLVQPQQGLAGGHGLMPVQSTIQPTSDDTPPLPMKPGPGHATETPETVENSDTTEVETVYSTEVDAPESAAQRMRRISTTIRYVFIVIEIVLALRFFLKLVGANPNSPFGVFLFGITDPLAAPFDSLVGNPRIGGGEAELTTLLALIVYPVFCWILIRGIQLMFYREQGGLRTVRQKQNSSHDGY
ncbi:MAG TPA: YggT family protein [Ktedonobacterales bacterium]|nr:YggT family protein [Ktedonobacterales bacterium]